MSNDLPNGTSLWTSGAIAPPPTASTNSYSALDDFPELNITHEDDELLTSLLKETGWGDRSKGQDDRNNNVVLLPIEWVVDIADKDDDWFLATAYGYNDAKQTLHVNVPDRTASTWTGDVALNPLAVRLLECCDSRSLALFKQLVRESAIEVDWDVSVRGANGRSKRPPTRSDLVDNTDPKMMDGANNDNPGSDQHGSNSEGSCDPRTAGGGGDDVDFSAADDKRKLSPGAAITASTPASPSAFARATLFLPLGNFVVVQVEAGGGRSNRSEEGSSCTFSGIKGCVSQSSDGDNGSTEDFPTATEEKECRLVRLDERVELLHCRGIGDPGEEAFYRVAEEGLVLYDPAKVNWRAYKRRAKMRRQDERRRGSLAPSSSLTIQALTAAPANGSDGDSDASLLEGVGAEIRSLARRALDLRDDLLTEHLATLRRVRRLVLDGSLEDGAALMEQADEAHVGVLDERHIRDKERITTDASALEILILAVAGTLKLQAEQATPLPPPTFEPRGSPSAIASGIGLNSLYTDSSRKEGVQGLPPPAVVTVSPLITGEEASHLVAASPSAGSGL